MGDISSRLREDSRKYKKAAVRINWELLLKQVRRELAHMPLVAKS
jgi:vesicle transport protein SEC22